MLIEKEGVFFFESLSPSSSVELGSPVQDASGRWYFQGQNLIFHKKENDIVAFPCQTKEDAATSFLSLRMASIREQLESSWSSHRIRMDVLLLPFVAEEIWDCLDDLLCVRSSGVLKKDFVRFLSVRSSFLPKIDFNLLFPSSIEFRNEPHRFFVSCDTEDFSLQWALAITNLELHSIYERYFRTL